MRKIIFVFLLIYINGYSQWTTVNSNTLNSLRDIIFTDSNTGYIVGDNGTVVKTINGGNNWSSTFTLNNTQGFISISFLNNQTGYILSPDNLYKTIDGGNNWVLIYTDNNIKNVVHFITQNIGFIGTNNKILKTIDGGASWTTIQTTTNEIKSISFPTLTIGFFTGGNESSDKVYKTDNQGITFNNYPLLMQSIKEKIYFINENVGYIIGWYSPWIKKTIDGGVTWLDLFNSVNNGIGGMDINFINETIGFHIDNSGGQCKLFATSNSGQTWTSELSLNNSALYGFSKLSTKFNKGVLIGANGLIYKKENLLSIIEEKKNDNNIILYPNPVTQEFKILNASNLKIDKVEIIDNCGRSVKTIHSLLNQTSINVSGLSAGVYSVILICNGVAKDVKSLIIQ